MSLIAQALVTMTEVEEFLQIKSPDHDVAIEYLINGVSQEFATYCGRSFLSTLYTSLALTADGTALLWLPNWPVTVLGTVVEDSVTLTLNTDFYADMDNGVLEKANYNWPMYDQQGYWTTKKNGVVITYTAGYTQASTLPADIKLAALREIGRQYRAFITKEFGEDSRSQGGSSVSLSTEKPDWYAVMNRYRRPRV